MYFVIYLLFKQSTKLFFSLYWHHLLLSVSFWCLALVFWFWHQEALALLGQNCDICLLFSQDKFLRIVWTHTHYKSMK